MKMAIPRNERIRALRKVYAKEGRCLNCGARPPVTGRNLCDKCLTTARNSTQSYRKRNPDADSSSGRKHRENAGLCRECGVTGKPLKYGRLCESCGVVDKQRALRLKKDAMELYGGKCACCGEDKLAFLTIDHINHDGTEKRKLKVHGGGTTLYRQLKKSPHDSTLQVLCWNCNCAKGIFGICPHEISRTQSGNGTISTT